MASGKPFYGDRLGSVRTPGEAGPTPKIKDMQPFDELSSQPIPILDPMEMLLLPTPSKAIHNREEPDDSKSYAGGGGVPKMQAGGFSVAPPGAAANPAARQASPPNIGAPPSPIQGDPRMPQLSSNYWNRVRQQEAMRRAASPEVAPSGPAPGAAAGAAYAKGGKVKFGFAKGGSPSNAFTKDYRK